MDRLGRAYAAGLGLTLAAAAVDAWLVRVSVQRPHPLTIVVAAGVVTASLVTAALMWRELGQQPGRTSCPRCGRPELRARHDWWAASLFAPIGLGLLACRLCGTRLVGRAAPAAALSRPTERRRHLRLPARFAVRVLVYTSLLEAVVSDISVGGCRLETGIQLFTGEPLAVELISPERGNALVVESTVVHAAGPHSFGVVFRPPDGTRDRKRLRWVVHRLLAGRAAA